MRFLLPLFLFPYIVDAATPTCSSVTFPAQIRQGVTWQGAITAGVKDNNGGGIVFNWRANANVVNVNSTTVVATSDANWIANGGKFCLTGSVPTCATGPQVLRSLPTERGPISSATELLGGMLLGLTAGITYHVAGLASGDSGATWCPEAPTTTTFTVPSGTIIQDPILPTQVAQVAPPTINGTTYNLGSGPCVSSGTPGVPGYINSLQACINAQRAAHPTFTNHNDLIRIPAGSTVPVYSNSRLTLPVPQGATQVSVTSSTFTLASGTVGSLGLGNGQLIQIVGQSFPPSPMVFGCGSCYSVINSGVGGNTKFQVSLDGSTALTLTNVGGTGTPYVVKWPIQSDWVVIKTDSTIIPDDGVNLDEVAYASSLGNIVLQDNLVGNGGIFDGGLAASHYYFQDLRIGALPVALANETDPPLYNYLVWTYAPMDNIIFDQVWFNSPPPPDRMLYCQAFGGNNNSFRNSVFDNCGVWRAMINPWANPTVGTTTLQYNNLDYTYTVVGNTKATCSITTTPTITFGGTAGIMKAYMTVPGCVLTMQIQTGMTASGAGWTVPAAVASPSYPVDGSGITNVLKLWTGAWNGSAITSHQIDQENGPYMSSAFLTEGNLGWHYISGTGPFEFSNNRMKGQGIIGPYADQTEHDGCGFSGSCIPSYNEINLTAKRNRIQTDPAYIPFDLAWNGSWWFGRNGPELKQGRYSWWDGNIIGPILGGVDAGVCINFLSYTDLSHTTLLSQPNPQSTSDVTYTNNTCIGNSGILANGSAAFPGSFVPNLFRRFKISNNLFFTNAYTYNPDPSERSIHGIGYGTVIQAGLIDSLQLTHNLARWQAGQQSGFEWMQQQTSGNFNLSNNLMDYMTEGLVTGFYWNNLGGTPSAYPFPNGFEGSTLLATLINSHLDNNIWLGTYSSSMPGSTVDMTTGAVTAKVALYPGNNFWPNVGSTSINRTNFIKFYSNGTYTDPLSGIYKLHWDSPYKNLGKDGLDPSVDIDAVEAAQGKVQNVALRSFTPTTLSVTYVAPDSIPCSVDVGISAFWTGTGSYTRSTTINNQRVQNQSFAGLPAHALIYYRVNCATQQPTGTFQLP